MDDATLPVSPAELCWDEHGLIPAVVQDALTGQVLTLAYMNAASLQRSLASGETWFWSRSRQTLWHKGETSGNTQRIVDIWADCDADALVVRVSPAGPACHTGRITCFFRPLDASNGASPDSAGPEGGGL
ncbi:MAG: phosphoribosyl-AMP cyclohydrolase [Chloroflexi bacterium]|nr:phosphoribosyl-AMP cyclohydrolase [Chloroflexota bacterium]